MSLSERLEKLRQELGQHVENIVHFDVTDSTHALARQIITEMDEESQKLGATLILADRQERGEGRGGRGWESPEGGLYLNWLRSGVTADTITQLPMLAAAAALDAISRIGIDGSRIKWPNDILISGRKVAGILVYARHGGASWVTVGFGVNLETVPVIDGGGGLAATSVAEQIGLGDIEAWRHEIVCSFIRGLDRLMADPDQAIAGWRAALIQQPGDTVNIRLASGGVASGTLVEVTEEGFLKIRANGKQRVITGGDIIES
jgi:BirA family biotin operon repressor/biotin-[acetyl-CoA-carboxylase] ligase